MKTGTLENLKELLIGILKDKEILYEGYFKQKAFLFTLEVPFFIMRDKDDLEIYELVNKKIYISKVQDFNDSKKNINNQVIITFTKRYVDETLNSNLIHYNCQLKDEKFSGYWNFYDFGHLKKTSGKFEMVKV